VEQIKKFRLLPVEWSVESGELTPKMNFKRKIVLENISPTSKRSTPDLSSASIRCSMNEEKRTGGSLTEEFGALSQL
jgi:hypothetical protein